MPVIKYEDVSPGEIKMEGAKRIRKANVIANEQGWQDHALRVFRIGPGGYTPRHEHDWEHVNYVIRGKGRLRLGNNVYELGERDFAFVPPNVEHQFENSSDADFEFICIVPNRGEH